MHATGSGNGRSHGRTNLEMRKEQKKMLKPYPQPSRNEILANQERKERGGEGYTKTVHQITL